MATAQASRKRLIIHATAWTVLIGAYLAVSAPKTLDAVRLSSFGPVSPMHTTDNYLRTLIGVRNGSDRLLEVLKLLPQAKPMAIIVPLGDAESSFVAAIVTYFGWPREAQAIKVAEGESEGQLRALDPSKLGAVIFCGVEPPAWAPKGVRVGNKLVVLPLADEAEPQQP